MRMITSELESARLLEDAGFTHVQSEAVVRVITHMDIHNLYSSNEVDTMLSETVERVFDDNRRKNEALEARYERQFEQLEARIDRQYAQLEAKIDRQCEALDIRIDSLAIRHHEELKSSRRWVVGTIITVGMALATYLSALIKLYH